MHAIRKRDVIGDLFGFAPDFRELSVYVGLRIKARGRVNITLSKWRAPH
jgi:hypothetical protein